MYLNVIKLRESARLKWFILRLGAMNEDSEPSNRGKKYLAGSPPSEVHQELIDDLKVILKGGDVDEPLGTLRVVKP
jgi:hypothetical protein